jgi:hypothetical protein
MQADTGLSALTGLLGSGGPTVLLKDTFTDSNGTALHLHAMDVGAGWTEQNGTWQIQSNAAQRTNAAAAPGNVATANAGNANVTISLTINFAASDEGGIIARFQDISNFWLFDMEPDGPNGYSIMERSSGSWITRASGSFTFSLSTNYTIQLVCSGTTLTGTINGGNTLSYASASDFQTATLHGIRFGNSNSLANFIDNFQVTNP